MSSVGKEAEPVSKTESVDSIIQRGLEVASDLKKWVEKEKGGLPKDSSPRDRINLHLRSELIGNIASNIEGNLGVLTDRLSAIPDPNSKRQP